MYFLTNDHFKVLNMTFIHVILIRCYWTDLFTHTVIWYIRFWKIETDDGLLWILFNRFQKFILLFSWHTGRNEKMSDVMGLTKLDLSMLVFVSWYDPPKTILLQVLFLEMFLYCLKTSVSRPLLKKQIFYYSLFLQLREICGYINECPQEYFKHNLISYTSWDHSI